jgi:MFS family permease
MSDSAEIKSPIRLGLRENLSQFSLLVLINAFVGATVGLERTVLPLIAEQDFDLASKTAILSFIATFGIVKALSNLLAGRLSDRLGRKKILVAGWLAGLPVPGDLSADLELDCAGQCAPRYQPRTLLVDHRDHENRFSRAQPPRPRHGSQRVCRVSGVGLTAFATGYIASVSGLRPQPFYLGIAFVLLGLMLSAFFVKETREYALQEGQLIRGYNSAFDRKTRSPSFAKILLVTSWKDRALFSCSQAGMINNLNDGVAWGLFPLLFASGGFAVGKIGFLAAVYPATWGLLQLWSGILSDRLGRKWMIVVGMWVQALGIWLIALAHAFAPWLLGSFLLGLGTALVYLTLLAAVSDVAHPEWRASAVGVYRLWRDGGYALGAILSGIVADLLGLDFAIAVIGVITFLSGVVTAIFMYETIPAKHAEEQ